MTAKKNPVYEERNQPELTTEKCSRRKARENAVGIILLIGWCVSGANYLSQSYSAKSWLFFYAMTYFLAYNCPSFALTSS